MGSSPIISSSAAGLKGPAFDFFSLKKGALSGAPWLYPRMPSISLVR